MNCISSIIFVVGSVKAFIITSNDSIKSFAAHHHHHQSVSALGSGINNNIEKIVISHDNTNTRRDFLITSSSFVAAVSLLTIGNSAIAFETTATSSRTNDDISILATTPSISEGELTVSNPPPNREKVIVVDKQSQQQSVGKNDKKLLGSDPRFFIAGGVSAAVSHSITTPIDVVKTKMQTNPQLNTLGLKGATLSIIEEDGPSALLGGLGPTFVGYGIEGALKFGVYESLKPIFAFLFFGTYNIAFDDPAKPYLAAAVCAGALASIILCPMEETRIRLVTDPTFDSKGLIDGLPKLIKEEGFFSTFSGLGAMLSKQVPYTMAKQVSFDVFASMLYALYMTNTIISLPQSEIALGIEIGAAFLASVIACIASHPGDVLLTATYNQVDNTSRGLGSTISKVYDDGGIFAFFRGIKARFFHVGCIITFQLVIYDQIKQLLGLPGTIT